MNRFAEALSEIRERNPQLFDETALRPSLVEDSGVTVSSIDIPTAEELKKINQYIIEDQNFVLQTKNYPPTPSQEPWAVEPDEEDFDRGERVSAERRGFQESSKVATELLAIYLPFHFYPDGVWGVRFFERPVLQFAIM